MTTSILSAPVSSIPVSSGYAPLIILFVILILCALASQFWINEARWKNLIFGVAATVTVVVLLLWILRVLGVWSGPIG